MKRRVLYALCVIAFTDCKAKPGPGGDSAKFTQATGVLESETSKWVVSATGVGRVRFGMTLKDLGIVLGDSTIAASVGTASCTYLRPRAKRNRRIIMRRRRISVEGMGRWFI